MAFAIPSMLLKQLYTFGSLENGDGFVKFSVKNRLSDATITSIDRLRLGGNDVPMDQVTLDLGDGDLLTPADIADAPLEFPLRQELDIFAVIDPLPLGKHKIEIHFGTKPFGKLKLKVDGAISEKKPQQIKIPRSRTDDYGEEIIRERQEFVKEYLGKELEHVSHYSFDPHVLQGNIENFSGVAQIPLGFAGPLTIHGEHAKGDFIVPLATTEGTLVASYSRGMKILNLSGGVTVSVVADAMQRAPVFVFANAREAREFVAWVDMNIDDIIWPASSLICASISALETQLGKIWLDGRHSPLVVGLSINIQV
jgi:hydroxymethylglutaryl-CoA reductase (NADPH)